MLVLASPCYSLLFLAIPCYSLLFLAIPCYSFQKAFELKSGSPVDSNGKGRVGWKRARTVFPLRGRSPPPPPFRGRGAAPPAGSASCCCTLLHAAAARCCCWCTLLRHAAARCCWGGPYKIPGALRLSASLPLCLSAQQAQLLCPSASLLSASLRESGRSF